MYKVQSIGLYGYTPLNSEKFMHRAVYHKVYVLKYF